MLTSQSANAVALTRPSAADFNRSPEVMWRLLSIVLLLPVTAMTAEKQTHRVGTYAELRAVVDSEHLVFCIPSLVSTLVRKERQKGSALTEEEAVRIRDAAPAIMLKKGAEKPIVEGRGYDDIDAERVWPEWQVARRQFKEPREANQSAQTTPVSAPR